MYTIKQASNRTGLGAALIRAWERRYAVVEPTRTAAGYRLYDETAIATLLTMRRLVDQGWTASEAARAIRSGEVAVDEAFVAAPGGRPLDDDPAAGRRRQLVERFVRAAEATAPADTERALDEILASGSFEAVVDDVLLPAAAALGDAWAQGRLSVAGEHAASAAIARRLAAAYQAGAAAARPTVVVGLPPGSRHELGALGFAVALRRRGVGVLYLGADVPVDAWRDVVQRTRIQAAVVGVITEADRETATAVLLALRGEAVRVLAVGGAAAEPPAAAWGDVVVLPARVSDAARIVAEALKSRG